MKRDFLEGLGLEKEAIDKILDENSRDIGREKAKADQAKEDLAAAKSELAECTTELADLKKASSDVAELQKKFDDLQSKYDTDTKAYQDQIADRDYSDAMKKAVSTKGIKFSSKAAEKAYLADLKEKHLELKDGALEGFDDWHKAQMEADPSAFQTDKPNPRFTGHIDPSGKPGGESVGAKFAKQFNAQYAPPTTKE